MIPNNGKITLANRKFNQNPKKRNIRKRKNLTDLKKVSQTNYSKKKIKAKNNIIMSENFTKGNNKVIAVRFKIKIEGKAETGITLGEGEIINRVNILI
jgi:hypothetical protein